MKFAYTLIYQVESTAALFYKLLVKGKPKMWKENYIDNFMCDLYLNIVSEAHNLYESELDINVSMH